MDFSYYPNIQAVDTVLGGSKQTVFNKKQYIQADEEWMKLSPDEMNYINQALPSAVRVMDAFAMPYYIVYMNARVLRVVRVYDVIWSYVHVTTQRSYGIPVNKFHQVRVADRYGNEHVLGMQNTGGFSKKEPAEEAFHTLVQTIQPQRRGMFLGWSQQTADMFAKNLPGLVMLVDTNSTQAQPQ